jgi:glycosyltransferase involved in cell wall biosynthesis
VTAVHAVVPDGIDDPSRPSGGNVYDRRLLQELAGLGWCVRHHPVSGDWPRPDAASLTALSALLAEVPDDGVVLLDGLVASAAPDVLVPEAQRTRQVALVHMPLGHRPPTGEADAVRAREGAVLTAATAVVTTSAWTRHRLVELYSLPAERIHTAPPGADAAALAAGTTTGGELLCVAAVTFGKGHDILVEALSGLADLAWRCTCVGSLDRDPEFAQSVQARAREAGLAERMVFTGPRAGAALQRSYATADLTVLPSRAETYGMVISEALACGLPVVVAEVGGTPEALGNGDGGIRPGRLVAPDDPAALGAALRSWLSDAPLRGRLREAARARRATLPRWSATASIVAGVLAGAVR